jgi:hypothetical protein
VRLDAAGVHPLEEQVDRLLLSAALDAADDDDDPDVGSGEPVLDVDERSPNRLGRVCCWGALMIARDAIGRNPLAPWQASEWRDMRTGRTPVSLGHDRYRNLIERAGLVVKDETDDEGRNHDWFARQWECCGLDGVLII